MSAEANAVCFAVEDYAPLPRRLGGFVIDLAVVVLLSTLLGYLAGVLLVPKEIRMQRRTPEVQRQINKYMKPAQVPVVLAWAALCVVYHVPIRRTRGGTLGYRLMGIRLVDDSGQTPSMKVLVKRFLIAIPFALLLGATYLHCRRNPRRQTTHDQWSGTWAVRRRAVPAGHARKSYQTRLLGTLMMTYVDLEPIATRSSPETLEASVAATDKPVVESSLR